MNNDNSGRGHPKNGPPRSDSAPGRRIKSAGLDAATTGRSAATAHGGTTWASTRDFLAERLWTIDRASRQLRETIPHCENKPPCECLHNFLEETPDLLSKTMPPELPFITSTSRIPHRMRVAVIMREWLLTSRHPRQTDHLRDFLLAYQEVSPLSLAEIRLLPIGLRLAVIDKCRLLPSAENSTHIQLLPRLIAELAGTCHFIARTDWKELGEDVSQVHLLLQRDPSQSYRQTDAPARDACWQSVERLSRLSHTGEAETAGKLADEQLPPTPEENSTSAPPHPP